MKVVGGLLCSLLLGGGGGGGGWGQGSNYSTVHIVGTFTVQYL
jgi:hypothetical protein